MAEPLQPFAVPRPTVVGAVAPDRLYEISVLRRLRRPLSCRSGPIFASPGLDPATRGKGAASASRSRLAAARYPGRRKGVMPFIGSPRSFRSSRRRLFHAADPNGFARGGRRTCPVRFFGFFPDRANRKARRPRRYSFPPPPQISMNVRMSILFPELFQENNQRTRHRRMPRVEKSCYCPAIRVMNASPARMPSGSMPWPRPGRPWVSTAKPARSSAAAAWDIEE